MLLINKKVSELIMVKWYSCNADWVCFNTLRVNNYFSSLMFSSQKLQNRVAQSADILF